MQNRIFAFRTALFRPSRMAGAHVAQSEPSSAAQVLEVQDLDARAAAVFAAPWRELAAHSRDPNVFFEPDFALAAAAGAGRRLRFVFVWHGGRERLLAVFPIFLPRLPLPLAMARLWTHKNSTCGMPLLEPASADAAWASVLRYCRRTWPWLAGLVMAGARQDRALAALSESREFASFWRAVLYRSGSAEATVPIGQRTLAKCRRRLERRGRVEFRLERSECGVAAALDAFLALEASGWKAGRGALACRPALATFARAAINGLAAHDRSRVAVLSLDGTPIAAGIVLVSARRAFFWKIAYDERYAAFSPGALLSLELTAALRADSGIDVADSCADSGHPMIDKIWPDRECVATVLVPMRPGGVFKIAAAMEIARHAGRQRLKGAVHGIRRWIARHKPG